MNNELDHNDVLGVFTVPVKRVPWLQAQLVKLNKKAAKLNCDPTVLTVLGDGEPIRRFECQYPEAHGEAGTHFDNPNCRINVYPTKRIMVVGDPPVLNGWVFAAVLQHVVVDNEIINIIRVMPHFEHTLPTEYRNAQPENCDHCKAYRNRRDTYVVYSVVTNEYKQVGSNCLKDFLGHTNPETYARLAEALDVFYRHCNEDINEVDRSEDSHWTLEDFLALANARIRKDGWVSKKTARDFPEGKPATAIVVVNQLTGKESERHPWFVHPSEQDVELAETVAEWAKNLEPGDNDYLYNLNVVARQSYVGWRTSGIAASMISAWRRANEEAPERKDGEPVSEYVGQVGERVDVEGLVVYTNNFESEWGIKTLVKVKTDEGNIVTWWSTAVLPRLDQGQTIVKMRGTVKKLEMYKGVKTTNLTRCKLEVVGRKPRLLVLPQREEMLRIAMQVMEREARQEARH